jgi:hypothetical protein
MYLQFRKPRCDLLFIAFNIDGFSVVCYNVGDVALRVCDVALRVFDVALRVFDGEQSVLRTQVCNTQLLYPRYWVTHLGYRLDLYGIQIGPVSLSMFVVLDYYFSYRSVIHT